MSLASQLHVTDVILHLSTEKKEGFMTTLPLLFNQLKKRTDQS